MSSYIRPEIKRQVIKRAGSCCEYCRINQDDRLLTFEVDHIIAEKHEGETVLENLCLACTKCNRNKGSDIASIDRDTRQVTLLYNPRTQKWDEHFRLNEATIEALSAEGRVTIRILQLNEPTSLEERSGLIKVGRYPCQSE
jgi:Na+-translocating ferredoxin:NAD+ oxidoreductase RNF subunit RnfB